MATLPINHAAVLPEARAHPMQIKTVAHPTVGTNELVVHVGAIATNPVDGLIQTYGDDLFSFLQYPHVSGSDIAGTVVEVGPGTATANFSVGDRVLALAASWESRGGAFQEYVAVHANLATKIPPSLSLTDATVLPLGVGTAAAALHESGQLELELPSVDTAPNSRGQVVLVWGGASSVGANTIQLAVASGYEVFTTSSPHNFELCRSLSASQVFDYKSSSVVADIIAALQGKTLAGTVSIFAATLSTAYEVVGNKEVQGSKKVASVNPITNFPTPPAGVTVSGVYPANIKDNGVGVAVFHEYLEKALATASYQTKPSAFIVGKGLEALQSAVDLGKEAKPSAKKLVVTLE